MTEKLEILSMIREGVITPEEGVRLLEALDTAENEKEPSGAAGQEPRWLNIEIRTRAGSRFKSLTPIRIPYSMIRLFFRFLPAGATPRDFDPEELLSSLASGEPIELLDDDGGRAVRITAE